MSLGSLKDCGGGRALQRGLAALMWLLLVAYGIGLALHGPRLEPFVDLCLGALTQVVPALLCWAALPFAGSRRREVACLAVGMSAFAGGNVVFVLAASQDVSLPFPSTGDAGYLSFYPLALAAIALAVRREHRTVPGAVWLDSLLGGLAAAAVLAVVLNPVIANVAGSPLEVAVSLAYPLFDLLLAAAIVGIAALEGFRYNADGCRCWPAWESSRRRTSCTPCGSPRTATRWVRRWTGCRRSGLRS